MRSETIVYKNPPISASVRTLFLDNLCSDGREPGKAFSSIVAIGIQPLKMSTDAILRLPEGS